MKTGRSPLPFLQLGEARNWLPFAVLAGALTITLIAALYVNRTTQAKDRERFDSSVSQISTILTSRLDTYVALLRAASGLFAASDMVEADEFRRFVAELDVSQHYPGIQGIGFSIRLKPEERNSLTEMMHRTGNADFVIKPDGERPEYYPIIYLEPLDRRNSVAIGYDMFTEPVRRAAMERARDTGMPAASGRVTLVQEIEEPKQSGFLIYMPVYRKSEQLETVGQRQASLVGFVYSPFRAGDLLPKILTAYHYQGIDYQVFAGPTEDPANALYSSNDNSLTSRFESNTKIRVAGSEWLLKFKTNQDFAESAATNFALLILLSGVLLSVVLFAITRAQTGAHARAVNAARELKHSEKSLRRSLRERETAQDALRRSKADLLLANYRFQVAEEASKSFHYDWNLETDTVVRSENFSQVLGYHPGEIADTWEAWKAITHAEDFPISKAEAIEYLTHLKGDKLEAEYRVRHKDGKYRNLYNRGIILRDDQGRPRRVIGQTVDITERKHSEEEVRRANERYRELFENANDVVYTIDLEGRVTSVNKAGETITGYSAAELLGQSITRLLPPESMLVMSQMLERKLSGETRTDYELEIQTKSGKIRTLEISSRLIFEKGEPGGIQGIARDVTERRIADAELRAANERAIVEYEHLLERIAALAQKLGAARELSSIYRALQEFTLASAPCNGLFVSLYDDSRDVRTASYGWGDDLELDVSDLPPMPVTKDGPNSRAVRTGEVIITDDYMKSTLGHPQVVVGPENGLRPQSSMAVPMSMMGRVIGTIELQSYERLAYRPEHATAMRMAANLTAVAIENTQLLARESQARKEAEESNRLKDEFLATVSHELRTPLTAIFGWARLLESGTLGEAQSARAIETIQRNAKVQGEIIDDILDVSRIITGNLYLEFEPTELSPIIEAATNVVRPTAEAKNIRLEVALAQRPALVSGDPQRLQQIIWNLLANAIKFTPEGGRVGVRMEQTDSHVFLRISDSGQGISSEFLPHVFERFRQADSSTTRKHGGLGLGLAIVRHLVEIHGGSVVAQSEGEGKGATFIVLLPLLKDGQSLATGDGAIPITDWQKAKSPDLQGVHVLLVDDDAATREMLSTALNERHARVTAVASTREALSAIKESPPDVLVSDIAMPFEDGYDLIASIRSVASSSSRQIPAVAITAYAREEDRRRALAAGYQSYLPKPIEPSELIAVVAELKDRINTIDKIS